MNQMGNPLPEAKSPMREHPATIHLAMEEAGERANIESTLRREGFSVRTFGDGESFLDAAAAAPPDIALLGIALPGAGCLETISRAKRLLPETVVLLLSDQQRAEFSFRAMRQGALDVILAPYPQGRLLASIENAIRTKELSIELKRLRSELRRRYDAGNITGTSAAVCRMREEIGRLAQDDAPVLFLGERGAGKDLAARVLHYASRRADEPFFSINCAVLRKGRPLDEVFAPLTGISSRREKIAPFEPPQGGTLFLDEIGEIDSALLEKLSGRLDPARGGTGPEARMRLFFSLRTCRRGEIERDVRDFLSRFSPREVLVPPLRARPEDIEPLIRNFLAEDSREPPSGGRGVSPEAMTCLRAYPWPGNVRELKNVLRQAAIMSGPGRIGPSDLPPSIRGAAAPGTAPAGEPAGAPGETGAHPQPLTRPQPLKETERRLIREALDYARGNISRTASLLEISRSALYRRIEKLEISRNGF